MKRKKVEIGKVYNRLTVIKEVEKYVSPKGSTQRRYLTKCECGNEKEMLGAHIMSGKIKSCGCYNLEKISERIIEYSTKHNLSKHPLYAPYHNMKHRCYNPNNKKWRLYGGRGIKIEDCWLGENGFVNFLNDMGERPEGKTLDRIDNDGNYGPNNCRWATVKEQNDNRGEFVRTNQYTKK